MDKSYDFCSLALLGHVRSLIVIFSLYFIDSTYEIKISKDPTDPFEDIFRRRRKTRIRFFNNGF